MDHYDYYSKRSGQIPRFGDWENANEMPITQYFENARQAGLIRDNRNYNNNKSNYTSSSSSSSGFYHYYSAETLKIPSHNLHVRSRNLRPPTKAAKTREKRGPQNRVYDVTEQPNKGYAHVSRPKQLQSDVVRRSRPIPNPKPVDEDLYKIPPELLHSSKRKKIPGFFTCLVPCAT